MNQNATPHQAPGTLQIEFAGGILGFPECRRFALLPTQREGLYWLQSLEHDTLTFLLADPFLFVDDYVVDLGAAEIAELDTDTAADIAVLAVVTLPRSADESCTVNLQGPLAINLPRGQGRQIVLGDVEHGLRRPIELRHGAAAA